MLEKKPFLIITGPTGVGKTELASQLAEKLPIEIVNCDVGQFYEPLSIGTAKPDWKNESIPHHLFDYIKEPRNFSVTEYRAALVPLLQEVQQRGNIPVLVGGSLFYIKSLFFPPLEIEGVGEGTLDSDASPEQLWEQLHAIDPERAQAIEKSDTYRLTRALAIWKKTGVLPSALQPDFQPLGDFYLIFVNRERSELYDRINKRFQVMFDEGWVEEVVQLPPEWKDFLLVKRLIGYSEIIECLQENKLDACKCSEQLLKTIKKKTRNYAKRQVTFWRMLKKQLDGAMIEYNKSHKPLWGACEELNLTLSSVDLYLSHVVQVIQKKRKGKRNE